MDLTQGHKWEGHGYFDANFGTAALEADFRFWTWGRLPAEGPDGLLLRRHPPRWVDPGPGGGGRPRDGRCARSTRRPLTRFRRSLWAVRRETRADPGFSRARSMSLLDAPFYSRSLVETQIDGETTVGRA